MSRSRKVNVGRLPRVMVRILALDEPERREVADAVMSSLSATPLDGDDVDVGNLAVIFSEILDLPKHERACFCGQLNQYLDDLVKDDVFGTEGQLDPRGDHRE